MPPTSALSIWPNGRLASAASGRPPLTESGHEPISVLPITRWALYALAFTIPVETLDLGIPLSITSLACFPVFLLAALQPALSFRRPSAAFWWFALYVYIYVFLGLFQDIFYQQEILKRALSLVQLLVLFWIVTNLLRDIRAARGACWSLALSCTLFAGLQVAGVTSLIEDSDRISAFGQNPNEVALFYSLGLLTLCNCFTSRSQSIGWLRWLMWPALGLLGLAIVQTGSRGGMVCLVAGWIAFVAATQNRRTQLRGGGAVFLAVVLIAVLCYSIPAVRHRWEAALGQGNMAHREQLFPAAWKMVLERPWIGWGPGHHLYELGRRTVLAQWGEKVPFRDTHNLYLYVLTATGILGATPFFLGLAHCLGGAWRARRGSLSALPLTLLVAMLVANLSGTWLYLKVNWIVFAVAVAGGNMVTRKLSAQRAVKGVQG